MATRFAYPQRFAERTFERLERALRRRVSGGGTHADSPTGRLFVLFEMDRSADSELPPVPDLPVQFIRSSDPQLVAARKAEPQDESRLLSDRHEGKHVLSYKTPGGWAAITKSILTEILGEGRDVKIVGLRPEAVGTLKLTCPNLVVVPENV